MLVAAIAVIWVVTVVGILVAWSQIHSHDRWMDGIDERAHIDGLDEGPLAA
jgi:hypothetical protein